MDNFSGGKMQFCFTKYRNGLHLWSSLTFCNPLAPIWWQTKFNHKSYFLSIFVETVLIFSSCKTLVQLWFFTFKDITQRRLFINNNNKIFVIVTYQKCNKLYKCNIFHAIAIIFSLKTHTFSWFKKKIVIMFRDSAFI